MKDNDDERSNSLRTSLHDGRRWRIFARQQVCKQCRGGLMWRSMRFQIRGRKSILRIMILAWCRLRFKGWMVLFIWRIRRYGDNSSRGSSISWRSLLMIMRWLRLQSFHCNGRRSRFPFMSRLALLCILHLIMWLFKLSNLGLLIRLLILWR